MKITRLPYENYEKEKERVAMYWKMLNAIPYIKDESEVINTNWRKLKNENDADYEAKHMNHSIGHSWSKYSKYGDIFSLRDEKNIPQVTILVSQNKVVHAREENNARLSDENMKKLDIFCEEMEFLNQKEPHPFDFFLSQDEDMKNTKITYLLRHGNNEKRFSFLIFEGRIEENSILNLIASLEEGKYFKVQGTDFLPLNSKDGWHEISCISHTKEPATNDFFTRNVSIEDGLEKISNHFNHPKF